MKEEMGRAVNHFRISKSYTMKQLSDGIFSVSQLSNIENGQKMPSAEKFIKILAKLNLRYEEFIMHTDDCYLKNKIVMEKRLSEAVKGHNIKFLEKLVEEATAFYSEYDDVFFEHISLMASAMKTLIKTNNNYERAREFLIPIKEYLGQIENWSYYEFTLLSNCLYMFEVEDASLLGKRALSSIENNFQIFRNDEIACSLLLNLSIYFLDYPQFYSTALKYSQMGEELAYTSNQTTKAIHAKIICQLAYFKLDNGKFDKEHLLSLINIFDTINWSKELNRIQKFIIKHGISI